MPDNRGWVSSAFTNLIRHFLMLFRSNKTDTHQSFFSIIHWSCWRKLIICFGRPFTYPSSGFFVAGHLCRVNIERRSTCDVYYEYNNNNIKPLIQSLARGEKWCWQTLNEAPAWDSKSTVKLHIKNSFCKCFFFFFLLLLLIFWVSRLQVATKSLASNSVT